MSFFSHLVFSLSRTLRVITSIKHILFTRTFPVAYGLFENLNDLPYLYEIEKRISNELTIVELSPCKCLVI